MATRDQERRLRCQQGTRSEDGEDMASVPSKVARIGTKGCFFFMELPVELRLKVRLSSGHPGPHDFCGKRRVRGAVQKPRGASALIVHSPQVLSYFLVEWRP